MSLVFWIISDGRRFSFEMMNFIVIVLGACIALVSAVPVPVAQPVAQPNPQIIASLIDAALGGGLFHHNTYGASNSPYASSYQPPSAPPPPPWAISGGSYPPGPGGSFQQGPGGSYQQGLISGYPQSNGGKFSGGLHFWPQISLIFFFLNFEVFTKDTRWFCSFSGPIVFPDGASHPSSPYNQYPYF